MRLPAPSAALFRATRHRSPWMVALFAALLAALGLGASRLRLDEDLARFFPPDSDVAVTTEILETFRTVDQLVVTLEAREAPVDALIEAGDALGRSLEESGLFARVSYRLDPEEQARTFQAYFPRRWSLLPKAGLDALLSPDGLRAALARTRGELMSPQASFREAALVEDPLGMGVLALERAVGASTAYRVEPYRNRLLSGDRRHLLILTTVRESAMDAAFSARVLEAVGDAQRRLGAEPRFQGIAVRVLGGPVWAEASARSMKRDIAVASSATAVGLVGVFLLAFRNLRTLLLMQAPGMFGVAAAATALSAIDGQVSGITLGFGAAVLGLSADYSLHLLTHASVLEAEAPRGEALERTLRELDPSIGMGWFTTLVSFLVLLNSRAGGLVEVATFAGIGITASWLACMVFLPHLHLTLGARRPAPIKGSALARGLGALGRGLMARPLVGLAAVAAATAALGAFAPGVRFNGDSRDLLYEPPEVAEAEARFEEVFGGQGASAMVVVEGATLEDALVRAEAVEAVLARARQRGEVASWVGVSGVLPSAATQRRNFEALAGRDVEAVIAATREEAGRQGFTPDAFEPFFAGLRALREGPAPVLTAPDLAGTPLAATLERSVALEPGRARVLTLAIFPSRSDRSSDADTAFPAGLRAEIEAAAPGAVIASRVENASRAVRQVKDEAARLMVLCLAATVALLGLYYRALLPAALALVPPLAALVWTFGAMALLGVPLNIVSICALVLIVGVGIDYGIYVVDACLREGVDRLPDVLRSTGSAVLLSSLATLTGFGTMALARNPSLATVGIEVVLGIAASIATALVLVPAALHAARRLKGRGAGSAAAAALLGLGMAGASGCAAHGAPPQVSADAPLAEPAAVVASALPASAQLVYLADLTRGGRTAVFQGYALLVRSRGLVFLASTAMGVDLFQVTSGPAASRAEVLFPPMRRAVPADGLLRDLRAALLLDCPPPAGPASPGAGSRRCSADGNRMEVWEAAGGGWSRKALRSPSGREVSRVEYGPTVPGQERVHRAVDVEGVGERYTLRLRLQDAAFDVPYDDGLFAGSEGGR